jgi:hypothetical protein
MHVVDDIDVANLDMYHPRTLHGCLCMGTINQEQDCISLQLGIGAESLAIRV